MLDVCRVGLRYRYLLDAIVSQPDVHAIAVITENLYLILVDDVSSVAADEIFTEFILYSLGRAA